VEYGLGRQMVVKLSGENVVFWIALYQAYIQWKGEEMQNLTHLGQMLTHVKESVQHLRNAENLRNEFGFSSWDASDIPFDVLALRDMVMEDIQPLLDILRWDLDQYQLLAELAPPDILEVLFIHEVSD
jgi:hypothetical protein